jgi:hypothetical protein
MASWFQSRKQAKDLGDRVVIEDYNEDLAKSCPTKKLHGAKHLELYPWTFCEPKTDGFAELWYAGKRNPTATLHLTVLVGC